MLAGLKIGAAVTLAGLVVSGCVETRISAPISTSPTAERLELRGMGGGRRGDFVLGAGRGTFQRWAGQSNILGVVDKRGGGRFDLFGPMVDRELSGRCRFDEEEVKLGRGVALTSAPLNYSCDFAHGGRTDAGKLIMSAAHDSAGSMFRYERKGVLDFEGRVIDIRSIHSFQGGRMKTITPLGYSFEVDGLQIGAIDTNGLNKTVFAPRDPALREAVLAASLALSIFWDPADSD